MCGLLSRCGESYSKRFLEKIGRRHADQGQDEHVVEIHPAQEFIRQHIAERPRAQTIDGNQTRVGRQAASGSFSWFCDLRGSNQLLTFDGWSLMRVTTKNRQPSASRSQGATTSACAFPDINRRPALPARRAPAGRSVRDFPPGRNRSSARFDQHPPIREHIKSGRQSPISPGAIRDEAAVGGLKNRAGK